MKVLRSLSLAALLLLPIASCGAPAFAQVNRSALQSQINSVITTNNVGAITGAKLNAILNLIIQSVPTLLDANTFAAPPIFTTLNGCLAANLTSPVTGTSSACGSGGGGGGTPGGSTNAVQYNGGSSTFAGVSLGANQLLQGTAGAPSALSIGSGVATALGDATNAAGGFVTSPVANANLANASMTIAGHSVALGATQAISCGDLSDDGTGCKAAVAGGTSGQPAYYNASSASLASETLSALLDANISSTQGSILYRGASSWAALGPGTSGWYLKTQGASANPLWAAVSGGGSGCVPSGSAGQILSDSGSGACVSNATGVNILTALGSAENGSGALAGTTSPTFVTPALGTPASATLTNATGLPIAGIGGLGSNVATALAATLNGSGALTATTSPAFVTPALGTPASGVLTHATGLPISTGLTGAGTGVLAALADAVNATGGIASYPVAIASGISGLGTGVGTALGDAVNTAGGFITSAFNPASLTASDQTLSGGANLTVSNAGTGSYTVDCGQGPGQYLTDTGALTITAPANDGECEVQLEMGAGAAIPTFSGFHVGSNTGDAIVATSGNYYTLSITRIHSRAIYSVFAQQ